jgi:hypothetical protein
MSKAEEKDNIEDYRFVERDIPCPICKTHATVEMRSGNQWQCVRCKNWFQVVLTGFRPSGMQEMESPFAEITITPTEGAFDAGQKEPVGEPRTPGEE